MSGVWRKILTSVLFLCAISSVSSAGNEGAKRLAKSSLVIEITSNVGWVYNAGRPVAKDMISACFSENTPNVRNEIMRHPIQRLLFSDVFWLTATACSSMFNF